MDIKTFLQAYESIVKGEADDAFIDQVFLDVFERIEGSYLEDDFNKAEDRIGKIMAIDKAAHYMHSKDPDILAFAFPEADAVLVKETLDRLSGLEAVSPVRKASRGYFTTFASVEGLTFLQKQVGELKANRATMDEIKADIEEYERLYKAGIVSHAELLVLSRFYGDKGQRYRDELKKGYPGEDPMVVGGYASVEVVDKEGHLITTEALTKAFDKFMKSFRTRNVNFAHCLKPETLIWKVPGGYVPISSIKQGDYVLTDRGRPREVEEVITHDFDSLINVLELANGEIIRVTDEHPILTKRGWVKAKDLTLSDVLLKAVLNGSIETRQKMSEAKKGKRGGWCDPPRGFCVKNDSDLRKGKLWSEVYGHEKPYYGGNDAEKNPNWKGGIARLPYTYEYNAKKQSIFDRDGHRCRLCGKTETQELDELDRLLSVHHIDYIKSHDEDANLVTLCGKCNSKVNFDRDTWKNFFTEMLSGVLVQNGTSIVSISKEPYKGKVWNLHVHEDHTYVGRGIIYHNSDVQAGWPLRVWINQKGEIYKSGVDDKGLYLVSEVRPDITIANKVEKEIEAGVIRSYSIAGSALDKSVETKGNRVIMVVNDLELAEISFCFPGYVKVHTLTGQKPISEIVEDESVITHKMRWKKVTKTMCRNVDEALVRMTTTNGIIEATNEHPIRVLVYGGRNLGTHYEWKPIKNVQVGDLVSFHQSVGSCKHCGIPLFENKGSKYCSTKCRFASPGNRTGATIASGDPGTIRQAENHRRLHREGKLRPWTDADRAKGFAKRLEALHSEAFSKKRSKLQKVYSGTSEGKTQIHRAAMAAWKAKLNDPEKLEKWFRGMKGGANHYIRGSKHQMTKPELKMQELLNEMFPGDWVFSGDGKKAIEGKFPDFWNGDHKVIEVFGSYWHQGDDGTERIKYFRDHGYDCLVVTDTQLESEPEIAKSLVTEFVGNRLSEVMQIEKIRYQGLVYNIEVEDDNSYLANGFVVHNCERPVNQESHFDIIKSLPSGKVLGEMLTKQQVLEALPKGELPLSDYTVCLVGRDLVIRADKDSFLGKAIKLALSQELPVGIKDNVKIIFEAEGPHSDYVPLWNIRLGPVSRQEVRLADLSKAGKQLIGMTDADLKKLGEKIGINFDTVSFKEFKMGLQIECEHYDVTEYDPEKTARIVLAHLRELPDYYTKLKGMENPQPTMPESIPEMGKGKVVDNEVGMKRPEDQNDIDVKKESSGLKDKSGSNEQVKQSPNVQTPVTKVGEVHCAETMKKGLKGLQEYVSKAQPPAMAPPRPGLIWDPIGHRWKKPQIGAGSDEYSWAQFEAGGKMYRVGHSAKSDQYIVDVNDGSRWHSIASGLKSSREAMDKIKQLSGTEPVAKSSTTRITSPALHPSLAIRHPKIRWGEPEKPVAKKSMTQSGMAGMAAFLDFIQDAENKSK